MQSDRRCSRRARRRDRRGEDGFATAELAACLPVLVLLLAFVLSVVSVGSARVRVSDAAREAARAAARGDEQAAHRLADALAPGAAVQLVTSAGEVRAVVRVRQHLLASWLPAVTVTGQAVAATEPTQSSDPADPTQSSAPAASTESAAPP